ncbi:MAG TPA: portal protein [Castellaniella sp.]|uniref:portal protein n=1 Tax=Castellaniella sp. TaxID=1955812 RepID=UPI002F20FC3D
MPGPTERQRMQQRWGALKNERSTWFDHWREISEYVLPRSGRFFVTDGNRDTRRYNRIIDNTGTRAMRILPAGLMSGMTSPARPWIRLTTSDPELDESYAVKKWLADVTRLMLMVFAKSNTYLALHTIYKELGAFGTSCNFIQDDFKNIIHNDPLTAGEYALAVDDRGEVNTVYREFQLTVAQLVAKFGKEACSVTVRGLYDRGALDAWVHVVHVIEPRTDRDPSKRDARNMAWKSCYFELGANEDRFLRESGYKRFPVVAPRWEKGSGNVYGDSPAMEALGDIKQLQQEQLRKSQGIDYMSNPPLQLPTSLKNQDADLLPGGYSYVDMASPSGGIRTAFDVRLDLNHLLADIQDVRSRINSSFYVDLFMMLANMDTHNMTATEVAERHEEKLLMMGPVIERLHNEALDPLVDVTFASMMEARILPPPPQELQGRELSVEYISVMAQAQRAVATNSIDRYVMSLGQIAQFKPDVLDKFDSDHWADAYGDALGVDPELIVPGEKVALIRKQRAQAQQAQQQMAMAQQGADTAQKLGSIDTSKQSALTDATQAFAGYS